MARLPERTTLRAAAALAVAVLALVGAGCGGGSGGSETTATEAWANGVCSAFSDWKTSVEQVKSSVTDTSNLTKDTIQKALDDVQAANQKLVDDLSGLQEPETDAGKQAAQTVDTLKGQLQTDVESIQKSVQGGSLSALASIPGTMQTMQQQFQSALSTLKQLDAKGELQDAFKSSPACEPFFGTKSK